MTAGAAREAEVRDRLARVCDPELDEPVTELGFVTDIVAGAGGDVAVGVRLPTYWCAANFAFMMADDMRRAVAALPWVRTVRVMLDEHMYADRINDGLARGADFRGTFGEDAAGDLEALRRTFLVKAFQRRQQALLEALLARGVSAQTLAALDIAGLRRLEPGPLTARYLERRDVAGPVAEEARAFVTEHGAPIAAGDLPPYEQSLRRVGINVAFNATLCRGLLAAREPADASAGPGLRHFIAQARAAAPQP